MLVIQLLSGLKLTLSEP
uniref:Uncharacterized protein n=1 Tax=Anguilla anguilla TaxID=7936 RepID=A0A0E9VLT8_ANGAN